MRLDQVLDSKGSEVATISPQDTVAELVQRLAELRIGALVVSSDGETVTGIASERDIVRHLAQDGPDIMSGPVSSIMSTTVTCSPIEASTAFGASKAIIFSSKLLPLASALRGLISSRM